MDTVRTTHAGSLPRPDDLVALMWKKMEGEPYDEATMRARVRSAVTDVVGRQREIGIDVISDGEMSKTGFHIYLPERITGFTPCQDQFFEADDLADFPGIADMVRGSDDQGMGHIHNVECVGPIEYVGQEALAADLANFRAAVGDADPDSVFMCAVTPGTMAINMPNKFYPSYEEYMQALASALKVEYDAIVRAGFILQLDAPDLAMAGHLRFRDAVLPPFAEHLSVALESIDAATADIPPDRMRLHLCWGNYAGPHHKDIAISEMLPSVLRARPAGLSFEAANPRHEHEWAAFTEVRIPDEKVLIPGVIDNTSQHIEHPKLVAERLERFVGIVGRDRVIGGVDCGFSTSAGWCNVHQEIAWAKLGVLVEGAALV